MIRKYPDTILLQESIDIEEDSDLKSLRDELAEAVTAKASAVAVAAPQIGENVRAFYYEWKDEKAFIVNPKIIQASEKLIPALEGCLSLPEWYFKTYRSREIIVEYYNGNNWSHKKTRITDPFIARIFMHEIDHLDGILIPYYMNDYQFEAWEQYYLSGANPVKYKTSAIYANVL